MSDLLTAEERSALQESYAGAAGASRDVTPALFPSVNQLDPDRMATLSAGLAGWLEQVAAELAVQLRVPCIPRPPSQQTIARNLLPMADEEPFWSEVGDTAEPSLLMGLPRPFAAALCERVFGAPFQLRDDRLLSPSETFLLKELAATWWGYLGRSWNGLGLRSCAAPDPAGEVTQEGSQSWLRFAGDLLCGSVKGGISLAMPPHTARLLLGERGGGRGAPSAASMRRCIGDVPLELRAVLGRADFTLDELASLRVGDVIALERRASDPIEILIGDRILFRARAGLSGQAVALELIGQGTEE